MWRCASKDQKLNSAGVLADFGDIKKAVRQVVDGDLDHKYLNELAAFQGIQPTSERIAVYIAEQVQALLDENLAKNCRCPGSWHGSQMTPVPSITRNQPFFLS
jgi:6-pyruvoyl-tetrahydropterin synthase